MTTPRVYADFQNLDDENRIRLDRRGTIRDLEAQGLSLRDGLELTLYTDDADDAGNPDELRARGVVHYDRDSQCWVAAVDWDALWHASEEGDTNGEVRGPRPGAAAPTE